MVSAKQGIHMLFIMLQREHCVNRYVKLGALDFGNRGNSQDAAPVNVRNSSILAPVKVAMSTFIKRFKLHNRDISLLEVH